MNVKAVSLTAIAVIEHAESFSTSTAHEARAARAVIASAYIRQLRSGLPLRCMH
jgi:hypothetical protein